ncbi:MAG: hypothetical protein H5T73_00750 [Actinobacteria bacterium]|nr:hypothetical protein [Actinomycetota bacterium]
MGTVDERGPAPAATPAGEPRGILVIESGEDLHVLARFMRAMLLNLLKEPRKRKAAGKMDLAVAMEPAGRGEYAFTVTFKGGRVVLQCGVAPRADITIRCEPAVLMKLARVPAGPAALKFLFTPEGRDLAARFLRGELRMKGAARHPLKMMRFADLLAPASG